jgi:hypothetical protein
MQTKENRMRAAIRGKGLAMSMAAVLLLGAVLAWPAIDASGAGRSVAPVGVELTDGELVAVDGEVAPLLVLSAALGIAGSGTLFDAYQQTTATGEVNWPAAATKGLVAGGGVILSQGIFTAGPAIQAVAKSAVMSGLRWTAAAAAALGRGAVSVAQTAGEGLLNATRDAFSRVSSAAADTFTRVCSWFERKL